MLEPAALGVPYSSVAAAALVISSTYLGPDFQVGGKGFMGAVGGANGEAGACGGGRVGAKQELWGDREGKGGQMTWITERK